MARVLVISGSEVARLLNPADARAAVSQAQVELSAGRVVQPARSSLTVAGGGGALLAMPCFLPSAGALAIKVVTYFPANASRGEASVQGLVALHDPASGRLLAIIDAVELTALRTAAASAAATAALARPEADELALLGAGVQARSHLAAICEVRPIRRVRVVGRTLESAHRFCSEVDPPEGIGLEPVDAVETAVRGAGVICAVSSSTEALTRWEWVSPGTHINAVGAHTTGRREIDSETMTQARVVVDSRAAALEGYGDCLIPMSEGRFGTDHFSAELGEVLAGTRPGRSNPEQVTVFKSGGLAVQDAATAALVYERARDRGVGVEVDL